MKRHSNPFIHTDNGTLPFISLQTLIMFMAWTFLTSSMSPGQPDWVHDAITECSGIICDPAATHLTLTQSKDIEFDDHGSAETDVRIAVKILKRTDEAGKRLIELETTDRKISKLHGWLIPTSGNVLNLDDKDITEVGMSPIKESFDEGHILTAGFDEAGPGDVVAFEYHLKDESWTVGYQEYTLQEQQPVHFASASIKLPLGWRYRASMQNISQFVFDSSGQKFTWTVKDLPYRPEELLMPPWSFVEKRLTVVVSSNQTKDELAFPNWNSVARWDAKLCDANVVVDDSIRKELIPILEGTRGKTESVRRIGNYVRDKIRYVGVELGKGRWEPRPSPQTFYNKFGDCKDKVTLMRAFLAAAGIPSSIVLANSSHFINRWLPSPFQFNHTIIAIPLAALDTIDEIKSAVTSGWLFFDPTDEVNPLGHLPVSLQGSDVLVGTPTDTALIRLPYGKPEENQRVLCAHVELHETGTLDAEVEITDRGVEAYYTRYAIRSLPTSEQHDEKLKIFSNSLTNLIISDDRVTEGADSVRQTFHLHASNGFALLGNTILITPNIFQMQQVPAFTSEQRTFPLWFGGPRLQETQIDLTVPRGWHFGDEYPLSSSATCKNVTTVSYQIHRTGNRFFLNSRWTNTGELIHADEYEDAKSFSKQYRKYVSYRIMGTIQ